MYKELVKALRTCSDEGCSKCRKELTSDCADDLMKDAADTIEALEALKAERCNIVHCAECKHAGHPNESQVICFVYEKQGILIPKKPTDYCSSGEKEV